MILTNILTHHIFLGVLSAKGIHVLTHPWLPMEPCIHTAVSSSAGTFLCAKFLRMTGCSLSAFLLRAEGAYAHDAPIVSGPRAADGFPSGR